MKCQSFRAVLTEHFPDRPAKWSEADGEAVVEVLRHAEQHPKKLPTDPKKLAQKPRAFIGKDKKAVTIPEDKELPLSSKPEPVEPSPTEHTEMPIMALASDP